MLGDLARVDVVLDASLCQLRLFLFNCDLRSESKLLRIRRDPAVRVRAGEGIQNLLGADTVSDDEAETFEFAIYRVLNAPKASKIAIFSTKPKPFFLFRGKISTW